MRSAQPKHKNNFATLNRRRLFSFRPSCACLGLFLALATSCFNSSAQGTSTAKLTFDFAQDSAGRTTSLLSDNFSFSVTLDTPPEDSDEMFSRNSVGYLRKSIASIGHLADPEVNHRFVLFRRPVQPGLASLTWANLQAGYGRIFADDSVITRGNNGTAWEEPGCLFLKTRFRF